MSASQQRAELRRREANFERAWVLLVARVRERWGIGVFRTLGPTFQRALLAQEVLALLAQQDDQLVSDKRVRAMAEELFARVSEYGS